MNTGCYLLSKENFSAFEVGSVFSLENDILPLLSRSRRLKAICEKGAMVDIGVPEDYEFFTTHLNHGVSYE